MRCAILYLGRRGAGSALTKTLLSKFPQECVILSSRNEDFLVSDSKTMSEQIVITWPRYFLYFISPIILEKMVSRILIEQQIERVLLPMPSPLDSRILRGIRKRGFEVVSIVHDAKRHPGDLWPRNIDIKRIFFASNYIITLSAYVKSQLVELYGNSKTILDIAHPVFDFRKEKDNDFFPKDYFLFIGRIKKYKGVNLLLDAWKLAGIEDQMLLVAGKGRLKRKFFHYPFVSIMNDWLSEEKIFALMSRAKIIIFPYLESSQSGLIPLAISLQKRLVVSNLPGLQEQVGDYDKCTFFESGEVESLTLALSRISLEGNNKFNEEHDLELDEGWAVMNNSFRTELGSLT